MRQDIERRESEFRFEKYTMTIIKSNLLLFYLLLFKHRKSFGVYITKICKFAYYYLYISVILFIVTHRFESNQ